MAVGTACTSWPFISQMEPSAAALAAGGSVTTDLKPVAPGQQIVVVWRSRPVFIVHRTPALLAALREPSLLSRLRDPDSREVQQPPYADNWSRSIRPEFLVVVGVCTHLGCVPTFTPNAGTLGPDWPGGYLCHCHGSRYDLAGRVFQGVPAPLNLPVPPYRFDNATTVVIGENPDGQAFSLDEIEQI